MTSTADEATRGASSSQVPADWLGPADPPSELDPALLALLTKEMQDADARYVDALEGDVQEAGPAADVPSVRKRWNKIPN